jgi:hypothetical protein
MATGISAKHLELLKDAVRKLSRLLVLLYPVDPIAAPQAKELENAGRLAGSETLAPGYPVRR